MKKIIARKSPNFKGRKMHVKTNRYERCGKIELIWCSENTHIED